MATLLHDELVYVHSHGTLDDKASYLAALAAGTWTYDAISHDITVRAVGPATALAVGRMHARGSAYGRDVEVVSVTTSVWVATPGGAWLLRAFQSTRASSLRGDQ